MTLNTHLPPAPPAAPARPTGRVVWPLAAFIVGLVAVATVTLVRPQPHQAVFRLEAVPVTAVRAGVLSEIGWEAGATVRPGDQLAMLEAADATGAERRAAERSRLRQRLAEAEAKSAVELATRAAAIERDRLDLRLRTAALLRERFALQVRHQAADADRVPVEPVSLQTTDHRSRLAFVERENDEAALAAQIALCEDRLAELDRILADLARGVREMQGVNRLRSELEVLPAGQPAASRVPLVAGTFGRVGVYRKRVGEFVAAGETVVELFDPDRPYLMLTVPVGEAASFPVGRMVRVRFSGVETRKPLAGRVRSVRSEAETVSGSAVVPGHTTASVCIEPSGPLWPTRPPGTAAAVTLLD